MKKVMGILMAAAILLGTATGFSKVNAKSVTSKSKTSISVALQGEPTTLDPQYPDDTNMRWVTWNIYEPLVRMSADAKSIVPVLATSWKKVNSKNWEFKIRKGVKFQNGSAFTAKDAAYSVNRIISKSYGSQIASDFSTISKATVINSSTIRITTTEPDPLLLKRLTKLDIVSKSFVEGKSKAKLTTVANGTGPYKLVTWNRGNNIKLTANTSYWGKKPSIKKATYRFITEGSTRVSALQAGEVDLAANMLPEYVGKLPKVFTGTGMECYFMRFNELKGIFKNKYIRLAAEYAVDKSAIAKELFKGYAVPLQGQINKSSDFGYTKSVKMYPYSISKAKALLKQGGYNGEKIELLSEKSRWIKDGEVTETVASMLQAAGFNVDVKFVSWNQWLTTLFDKTKAPDLMFSSTSSEFMDADRAFSAGVLSSGTQSTCNNSTFDKLINQARDELNSAKRQKIYDTLNKALYKDPPRLVLVNVNDLDGGVSNLNWKLRKDGHVYLSMMTLK